LASAVESERNLTVAGSVNQSGENIRGRGVALGWRDGAGHLSSGRARDESGSDRGLAVRI